LAVNIPFMPTKESDSASGDGPARGLSPATDQDPVPGFGPFTIDGAALELRKDGRRVPLAPQAVRALIILAGQRGELVTRHELYAAIWGDDPAVDVDRGLNTLVRQIRRALGDPAAAPVYLQTYPGRGYRLLAEPPAGADPTRGGAPRRPWRAWSALAAVAAATLIVALPVGRRAPPDAIPEAAREDFLLGRHLLEQPEPAQRSKAVDLLSRAVRQAPDYAPAHAYLASALTLAGRWDEARAEVARAFALDSAVPRAWMAGSFIALVHQWDWARGESMLRRAIALDPGDAEAHAGLAFVLATAGKRDSAAASLARARRLDPVSAIVVSDIGQIYRYIGREPEAAETCDRAHALSDDPTFALECVLEARSALGQFGLARAAAARLLSASGIDTSEVLGGPGIDGAMAIARFRRWLAARADARLRTGSYPAFAAALALSRGSRPNDAVDALSQDARQRGIGFVTATVEPAFAPLRSDSTFLRLVAPLVTGGAAAPASGS
jgi:DNA-binding winged helix-turn-helix (wHTH) protein/Flp pilus assembly protein TadD